MTMICSVYGLYSTEDMVVRYIGQTRQSLNRRRTQHLAEALRPPGKTRCHRWIRKVLKSGFEIGIKLIEADCPWDEAEKRWIAIYRSKCPDVMTNISKGGCGYSGKRSMETRMKMRGPKSEAHKAKMRKPKAPDARAKMSRALIGNARGRGKNNGNAKISEIDVIDIKERLQRRESLSSIGAVYGVTKATVWKIKAGYSWTHVSS